MTYKRQFPMTFLSTSIITMLIFVTVPCAVGDGEAGCPAGCSCNTVDGFVNSREIKCSYVGLSDIPAMLNSFTVHTLDLSNNEISILKNASFSSYSRLSTLILSYGEVEEIEINAFAGLHMMRDIDLSYNKLRSFNPTIFSSNPVLGKVNLKGNRLVNLPSDSPILISTSISSLDLSSCSLTTIHSVTFSSLPSLYDLDLSSNNLQTISLRVLEEVPELRILELNNNPWSCNCDIAEVIQWAESRREQQPAHKPVKCLERQQYRTLWTMAGGNRSCSESKTTERVVARDREFTTDMTLTSETEHGAAPGWAILLSWNVTTLTVFVILPVTLGVAVFVSLTAVNYIAKRCKAHRTQHDIQEKYNPVTAFFSKVPLLKNQLTADITKQHAGYEKRGDYGVGGTEYHVYERID